MFSFALYVCGFFILLLTILVISGKHHKYGWTRAFITSGIVISAIIGFTPERTLKGSPFNNFGESKIAYMSCSYYVQKTAIFCNSSVKTGDCYCKNPNAMATIAYCYNEGYKNAINSFLDICQTDYNTTVTREQFDESFDFYRTHSREIDNHYNGIDIVDHPVKLNDDTIALFKGAYDQFIGNYDRSMFYGKILIGYWCLVFIIAGIANWSKALFPRMRLTNRITNLVRKHVTLPATVGKNKTNDKSTIWGLNMLVPTRVETLIMLTFLGLILFFIPYKIKFVDGDPVFSSKENALLRYYAVRASILTSEIMPLLILFGGRNNFLQWLTRWDYSTFITFHRWLSRVIFTLVVVHAMSYSLYIRHEYLRTMQQAYLIWGSIATICGGAIMFQGLLVLRRKNYELFLLLHIILSIFFIGGSWLHVKDLYCSWFYYCATVVWITDRIIRLGRIISFGFPYAEVSILPDNTLKVIVPKPKSMEVIPGGHVFIHFLRPSFFWQSHPFTYTALSEHSENITLYIKVKEGITLSLRNYLFTCNSKSAKIRVAIEGSYGESSPAMRYDSAVFVAGGSGIPGIFSEAYNLVKYNVPRRKVKLIWVIRDFESLYWFYEELLLLKDKKIELTIFVTKPNIHFGCHAQKKIDKIESHEFNENDHLLNSSGKILYQNDSDYIELHSKDDKICKMLKKLSHISFKHGRPSMDNLVLKSLKESIGSTCFVTCGPPIMVDELRSAVVNNINNEEGKRIDYYEQLQVWA